MLNSDRYRRIGRVAHFYRLEACVGEIAPSLPIVVTLPIVVIIECGNDTSTRIGAALELAVAMDALPFQK
jgi:hypothetical protein